MDTPEGAMGLVGSVWRSSRRDHRQTKNWRFGDKITAKMLFLWAQKIAVRFSGSFGFSGRFLGALKTLKAIKPTFVRPSGFGSD